MSKIKLVLQPDQFSSFTSWYSEPLWREYFDIEIYDQTKNYDSRTLFVVWWMNADDNIVNQLAEQGHKVVVDNLWEIYNPKFDKFYQLNNSNWCWYNESLWWAALGYDQYVPKKTYEKTALMPIRRSSKLRDWIVDGLGDLKHDMLWSYKQQHLPNDNYVEADQTVNQRYMNPQWHDTTCMNLVVETAQHGKIFWTTDKTYKACAYYQPMMIIGQANSLEFLKQQGFVTFENLWDESYDQEPVFEKRFHMIINNLKCFNKHPYCSETWKRLEHNRHHFFNEKIVTQGIVKEIIEPLLHYAET